MNTLSRLNLEQAYQGYTYSYPHKSAFREFSALSLAEVWKEEINNPLFFYVHIPFCEMRCGFCNLFTVANPKEGIDRYLKALEKEADTYQTLFPNAEFQNYAIGGGTPTFLEAEELNVLLQIMKGTGVRLAKYYGSIESSPKTLTADKIALIEQEGITRLSMGVQSWIEAESKALGRPQKIKETEETVTRLASSTVPEFNLDLIYGAENQTKESFEYSIQKTLDFSPTEIFLYPLYVRTLTGLEKRHNPAEDHRRELYLHGRDLLLRSGYEQTSMRCFRRQDQTKQLISSYDSLLHGMVGLGSGARSYTSSLHYSTDYAVNRSEVKSIISNYSNREDFNEVSYGIALAVEEQKRRFIIKSLTDGGVFSDQKYKTTFGSSAFEDFTLLNEIRQTDWVIEKDQKYRLSIKGMEYEDVIGPAFYSQDIKHLMKTYLWK